MNQSARSFHLLLERTDRSDPATSTVRPGSSEGIGEGIGPGDRLEVREGLNFLSLSSRKPPALVRGIRASSSYTILLQPLWYYKPPRLLMLVPDALDVRVNGNPAPPVSLLDIRDEVTFGRISRFMGHVTLFHNPSIGPPEEDEIGTRCPVCKVDFTRDTIVYRCHNCSGLLHSEDETYPEERRLECASICTECPTCQAEIHMEAGYRYLPEFCRK